MSMRDACDHFVELADVRQQMSKAQAERDEARRIAAHAGKCLMRIDAALKINDGSEDANAAFFAFVAICTMEAILAMKDALGPSFPKPNVPTPSERGG